MNRPDTCHPHWSLTTPGALMTRTNLRASVQQLQSITSTLADVPTRDLDTAGLRKQVLVRNALRSHLTHESGSAFALARREPHALLGDADPARVRDALVVTKLDEIAMRSLPTGARLLLTCPGRYIAWADLRRVDPEAVHAARAFFDRTEDVNAKATVIHEFGALAKSLGECRVALLEAPGSRVAVAAFDAACASAPPRLAIEFRKCMAADEPVAEQTAKVVELALAELDHIEHAEDRLGLRTVAVDPAAHLVDSDGAVRRIICDDDAREPVCEPACGGTLNRPLMRPAPETTPR